MIIRELITSLGLDFNASSFDRANQAVSRIKTAAVALGSFLLASKISGTLRDIVVSTAEAADSTDEMAQSVGISAKALQELSFAGSMVGTSQAGIVTAMRQVSKQAAEARSGTGDAAEAFARLGVRVTDSNGQLKSADALFMDVATGMGRVQSKTEKTALAMKVFGRSGAEMVPLLMKGADGIASMRAEVGALGAAFSDEFVQASSDFTDNLKRLELFWQGLKTTFTAALLPALNTTIEKMLGWAKANRAVMATRIESFARGLFNAVSVLVDVFTAFYRIAEQVSAVLGPLGEGFWPIILAVGALTVALGLPSVALLAISAAIALVIDDLMAMGAGGESVSGTLATGFAEDVEQLGLIGAAIEAINTAFEFWSQKILGVKKSLRDLFGDSHVKAVAQMGPGGQLAGGGQAVALTEEQALANLPAGEQMLRRAASFLLGPAPTQYVTAQPKNLREIPASQAGVTVAAPVTMTVNGAPGQDEQQIADIVSEQLGKSIADAYAANVPAVP